MGGPDNLALNGFSGLEPTLIENHKYLSGSEAGEKDPKLRRRTRRNAQRFLLWNGKLFRRTGGGLRAIPPARMRSDILRAFHDEIRHWDTDTTKPFVLDSY